MSERVVSHARGTARTTDDAVTAAARTAVLAMIWGVRKRHSMSHAPAPDDAARTTRYTRGRSRAAAARSDGTVR